MLNKEDGVWNTLISFNFCFIFFLINLLLIEGIHAYYLITYIYIYIYIYSYLYLRIQIVILLL